jgi:hypothetical protein
VRGEQRVLFPSRCHATECGPNREASWSAPVLWRFGVPTIMDRPPRSPSPLNGERAGVRVRRFLVRPLPKRCYGKLTSQNRPLAPRTRASFFSLSPRERAGGEGEQRVLFSRPAATPLNAAQVAKRLGVRQSSGALAFRPFMDPLRVPPSPLNGERAGVRGESVHWASTSKRRFNPKFPPVANSPSESYVPAKGQIS